MRQLPDIMIDAIVRATLAEDLGRAGDVTAQACIPDGARMRAVVSVGPMQGCDSSVMGALRR